MFNFLTEVVTENTGILNTAMELIKSYWPQLLALISTPIVTTALIKCVWKIINAFIKAKYQTKANIALTNKLEETNKKIVELENKLNISQGTAISLLSDEAVKNEAFRNAILSSNENYEVKANYEKEISNSNAIKLPIIVENNIEQKEEKNESNSKLSQENIETKEEQTYEKVETNVGISLD